MKVKIVTGYVPIPGHPRGPETYGALGEQLSGVPVPKKAFYMKVEDTWLRKYLDSVAYPVSPSAGDNPEKNTIAYHCVNHQKTEWLRFAANEDPDADVFVWVDYGIFRLPGVNNEAIYNFIHSLDDKHIYAPGCWNKPVVVEAMVPCWRFCGSVIAVPRHLVDPLDFEVKAKARQHLQSTRNVEWEVNTWARVEAGKRSLPWKWYKADHDVSMFTNAPTLEQPHVNS